MNVDWSQFRDGDRVRVVLEGTWVKGQFLRFGNNTEWSYKMTLGEATSAELIERPFTPPAEGTLFRNESLFISTGDGFRPVRHHDGSMPKRPEIATAWSSMAPEWLAGIEVLDV